MSGRRKLRDVPGAGAGAVCVFGCGRPVSVKGRACWPCQSYEEYLALPRCECLHEPSEPCRCVDDCTEDCPGLVDGVPPWMLDPDPDGDEAGQARGAPERSSGEA